MGPKPKAKAAKRTGRHDRHRAVCVSREARGGCRAAVPAASTDDPASGRRVRVPGAGCAVDVGLEDSVGD